MIIPLQHSYKYLQIASTKEDFSIGHPAFSKEPIEKYLISNLKEILSRTQKNGERLILLNKLSDKLLLSLPEEAYKYASVAWTLGKSIKAHGQLIKTNLILGAYYRNKQEFESALEHYHNVLKISLELDDKLSISNAYVQIGYMNWRLRRLNKSITSYEKALELYEEMNNDKVTLSLTKVLGELNIEIGNQAQAEHYFLDALFKQKELNKNFKEESKLLTKLGEVYLLSGQLALAETNFLKALSHNKTTNDSIEVANNSNNLGMVYMKQKRYDQAINCFNNALELNNKHSDTHKIAITFHHLGNVYYELEMHDPCIKNYTEALEAYKRIGDNVNVANLLGLMGKIHFHQKKYRKSILFLKQAISLSSILDDQTIIINSYFYLGKIALKTRDPETAITHFDNCIRKLESHSLQSEFLEVYQEIASCCAQLNQFAEAYKWEKKYNVLLEFKLSNSDKAKVAKLEDKTNVSLKKIKQLHGQNIELKRFISSAIDELVAPVRLISSFSSMLIKEEDDSFSGNQEEYLEIVQQSSNRISCFLKDVKTFTRIINKSNFPTINFSLETNVTNIIENLGINEQSHPNVELMVSELPKVNADPDEMTLVLESILINSLQHNAGKEIEIQVSCDEKEDHYVISIEDNGIGVDKAFHDIVFNKFTRISTPTHTSYEGTGIGLTMAKKVLNNRTHDIWMETPESGIGTRVSFTVSKPLAN